MLYISSTLSSAYFYKEDFLKILDYKDRDSAKSALSEWINSACECGIEQFQKCAQTMINWMTGILNSFSTSVTNGFRQLGTISRILANEFTEHRRNIVFRRCCVMSSRGSKVVNGQEITPQINQMPDICFLSTLSPPENAALFIGN